jgi:hypothetical protein
MAGFETATTDRETIVRRRRLRPGTISKRLDRDLTLAEVGRLRAIMAHTRVFDLPPKACDLGLDGAQWLMEGVDARGYHFVGRWTPEQGPVRELGMVLLGLTGWQFRDVY